MDAVYAPAASMQYSVTPVKFVCIAPLLGIMFNGNPISIAEGTTLESLLAGPVSGLIIDGDVYVLTLNATTMPWSLNLSCQGCPTKNIQAGLIVQALQSSRTYQIVIGGANQFTGTYTSYKGGPVLGESFAIGTEGSFNVLYVTSPYTPNLAGEIGGLAASTQTLSATLNAMPLYFCRTSGKKQIGSYIVVQNGTDIAITAQATSKTGGPMTNSASSTAAAGSAGLAELCGMKANSRFLSIDDMDDANDVASAAYDVLEDAQECNGTVIGLSVTVAVMAIIVIILAVLLGMAKQNATTLPPL